MPVEDPTKVKNFRTVDPDIVDVFGLYPVASWTSDGGSTLAFPVTNIVESGGNRLVIRERPFRDGAKLDDTGSSPIEWSMTALFENTISESTSGEPDLKQINGALLYPNVLNDLIDSFRVHETGDLVVPTRGKVRARCQSYQRTEGAEDRDCATLQLVFVEDNEDNVDAQSFTAPSASGSAGYVADETEFSEQSEGMWDFSMQDLNNLARELQGLANAPGQYAQDLEQQANTVMSNVDKVTTAFTQAGVDGRDTLTGAESTVVQRQLQAMKEMAGKARQAAKSGAAAIITKKYDRQLNIFQIATMEGQNAQKLIEINPQLGNLLAIPKNTPVRMFG